jgi:hypothetical protein
MAVDDGDQGLFEIDDGVHVVQLASASDEGQKSPISMTITVSIGLGCR